MKLADAFPTHSAFNSRKAAQISAFFAIKSGGSVNVLKLIKLLYLSERQFIDEYDFSMLGDKLVSMENGPACSTTLNYINGDVFNSSRWNEFISDRANHEVGLSKHNLTIDELDELSDAELLVLSAIWKKFGKLNQWQLVKYTHDNCPEWEDPGISSTVIPYERLLKYLGRENAHMIEEHIESLRSMAVSLSHAK